MTGGDILKFGLIAGGAWLLYEMFFSTPAPAAASTSSTGSTGSSSTSGTSSTSSSSAAVTVNPTTVAALQAAAATQPTMSGGMGTADQFSYLWTNNLGKPAISGTTFDAIFFPNGRPANTAQYPLYTAQQFVQALATAGLSGYKGLGFVTMPLPLMLLRTGSGYGYGGRRY